MFLSNKDRETLESMYVESGIERGGYINSSGVVECKNVHVNPVENFELDFDDLDKMCAKDCFATWHVHVNGTSNLTTMDYRSFQNYPEHYHFVVGKDGLSCYKVNERGVVVIEEIVSDEDKGDIQGILK